jgi:tetratricopeptide (TPR) repeat protein
VIGTIHERSGNYEAAQISHEQALTLEEQLQNPRGQGIALLHLGDTARAVHQFERSRGFYNRALAVTRRDNDQIGLARTLERLGDLGFDEGHRERANSNWVEALKIRESLHHSEEATALRERIRGGRPPRR